MTYIPTFMSQVLVRPNGPKGEVRNGIGFVCWIASLSRGKNVNNWIHLEIVR